MPQIKFDHPHQLKRLWFELTTFNHDSQVRFKVSRTNIFQETKKSQIIIIWQVQIYTKIPQTALNFM